MTSSARRAGLSESMPENAADRLDSVDPFAPAPLGPVTLRNRIIKAATF